LQHVLPRGLVRVRHYGLLANRGREAKLHTCRQLLLVFAVRSQQGSEATAGQPRRCAACGAGLMQVVELISRRPATRRPDSS
jgi:hypothetical protein